MCTGRSAATIIMITRGTITQAMITAMGKSMESTGTTHMNMKHMGMARSSAKLTNTVRTNTAATIIQDTTSTTMVISMTDATLLWRFA